MKKAIGYYLLGLLFFLLLTFPQQLHAQGFQVVACNANRGIETAIGCIETTPEGITKTFFTLALGIGGGIALLMILLGGLQIQTSSGDPKRLQAGREIIEGAVIGLLLIILSIVILRIVGVTILAIPGFS